jgi:hypothetical protein
VFEWEIKDNKHNARENKTGCNNRKRDRYKIIIRQNKVQSNTINEKIKQEKKTTTQKRTDAETTRMIGTFAV